MRFTHGLFIAVSALTMVAVGCSGAKQKNKNTSKPGTSKPRAAGASLVRPVEMSAPRAVTPPVAKRATAAAGKCARSSDCVAKPCCCGWDVRLAGAKTPERCRRKCRCKQHRGPRPTPVCYAGACFASKTAPVCKTKADCVVEPCRCGWIVWSKKGTRPSLCNARVNCASSAQKSPQPAFDCVNQRCTRK